MSRTEARRVLLCYVSGLDVRHIEGESTPFLAEAMARYPWVRVVNLPSNELFPTLVSGVDPTQHGVWGVKLNRSNGLPFAEKLWRCLPDTVTTTVQCCLHLSTNAFDLAAVPPRRRQRFDITRTKYKRRNKRREAMFRIGGVPTVFDVVGGDDSTYVFSSSIDPRRAVLPRLCANGQKLEVLELYSLDRYQQWNLDRPDAVLAYYTEIDEFLRELHIKCLAANTLLMLVSDHGHQPIRESIDIKSRLSRLGLPEASYSYFTEVSSVRFWFHSDDARRAIMPMLADCGRGAVVHFSDMHRHGVPLTDDSYGEVFLFLDPGAIFFPHDFHHGLANLWLGLTDPMQRSRLRDPRHKGNHGHLPHFDAEQAFVALLADEFETTAASGHILDIAPSILDVLGGDVPASMNGRPLFRSKLGVAI